MNILKILRTSVPGLRASRMPQDASGGRWRFSILAHNGDFLYSWVLSLDPILDLHSNLGRVPRCSGDAHRLQHHGMKRW